MLPSTITFDIPELREIILEYARPQDLLVWQRVNKTWQADIQRSSRIQEKLFYRVKTGTHWYDSDCAAWNPFLDLFCTESYSCVLCRNFTYDGLDGKASHPTASWRQMLMTSPAVTEVRATSRNRTRWTSAKSIICETGVTLGQLADAQKEEIRYRYDGFDVDSFWVSTKPWLFA